MSINRTTPASSPLDTLKALVLRNIDQLEYVTDQLGGSMCGEHEELLEFLDSVIASQYAAIGEHVAVRTQAVGYGHISRISDAGYLYDDGTPVVEYFKSQGITSSYHPRYNDSRDLAIAQHDESVAAMHRRFAEQRFDDVESLDDSTALDD